jgi:hypothetical protein
MATHIWTEAETERALEFWREYQRHHDVSAFHGKAVGIDILSGRVWFGETASEVAGAARAEGVDTSNVLGIRVGYDYYARKGVCQ